ncbi:LIC_10091 family protein [Singulisphaera rosea]
MNPEARSLSEILFPARDARFDAIIEALSVPETGPASDNLISNEDSYPRVAGEIAREVGPEGVYLGVGPDQNLTLLAHARPSLAFILDFRRKNLLLHLVHKALMTLAEDRVDYLSRLTARRPGRLPADPTVEDLVDVFGAAPFDHARLSGVIADVARVLKPLGVVREGEWATIATIQAKLAGPGLGARFLALKMYPTFARLMLTKDRDGQPAHFLARESTYQLVRSLQVGERILPLVGEFGRGPCLEGLGLWLRRHALSISLIYISDVEFFLFRSGRFPTYLDELGRLPWTRDARLVRTSTREIVHPDRVPGDSSTTSIVPVAAFLAAARAKAYRSVDDLFGIDEPQ